jgi:transcriptional regulator with XRE-family HTH domain
MSAEESERWTGLGTQSCIEDDTRHERDPPATRTAPREAAAGSGTGPLRALAQQLGLSRDYLGRVERGQSSPTVAMLQRIAQALHVRPATLLE